MAKSVLEIVFRTLREGTGDQDVQRGLKALEKDVKSTIQSFSAFAGVAAAVTAALAFSTREAMEAEKMQAKLNAVLKSTGGAAGMTQSALNGLADELSKLSGVDDELIISNEAVMLTFTQIGKQVFPEAMEAALNMNAVLGGDLQQSVIQLGKALNVTAGDTTMASMGLTAMRRSGVSFTEEQKNMAMQMVKTGDIIGYQKLLLEELNVEFGGAARAMGETTTGSAERLKNSLGNLGAAFGERLLPAVKNTNTILANLIDTITEGVEADNRRIDAEGVLAETMGITNDALNVRMRYDIQFRESASAAVTEIQHWIEYGNAWGEMLTQTTEQLIEQEDAIKAQSDANKSMLSLIQNMQSEYTSFTQKNEDLRLKLEELTLAQEKVPEWSSKYKDYQEKIDETKKSIDELATEHEEASRRIAFSLLQQKLASDGLTDAEFNNLLKIGESWGVLDAEVVESAISMNENMTNMAEAMQEPFNSLSSLNQQAHRLKTLSGSSYDFYVNIHTKGSFPSLAGAHGGGGGSANAEMTAVGGYLSSGWTLTGEAGPELISPSGYVFPADATRHLLSSGMIDAVPRASGGLIGLDTGEMLFGATGLPVSSGNIGNTYTSPSTKGIKRPALTTAVIQSEISQASQAVSVIAPMAEMTAAAVQTSASVQQASMMQTQALVSAVASTSGNMVNEQRETNRLLAEQSKTLARDLVAAMIQANP